MLINSFVFTTIAVSALFLYSYPYIRDILKGKTIPHPFTFLVFFILTSVNAYILFREMNWYALIPIVFELLIFSIYIYYGFKHFSKIQKTSLFDYICLFGAVSCIVIFLIFGSLHAVIATIIIDTIALLPTLKKVYHQPQSETMIMWAGSACFFGFLILAIDDHSYENTLFWSYLLFSDALTAIYIAYSQYFHKKSY